MNEGRQLCTFYLDDQYFGVDVLNVQEVLRYQEMTRVPLAPPEVEGLINLRGQIVTAIDMRRRLEMPERNSGEQPMNVIVRTDDGAVSLLVDEIGDVLEVREEDFEGPPETVDDLARELIEGAYKQQGRLLLVLSPDKTVDLSRHKKNAPGAGD
jgi:purine-binding chemotaxis protein CheW